jgi:hemoglobin
MLALLGAFLTGCGNGRPVADRGYFTSGSREADQRADQRMAQAEQLSDASGSGLLATNKPRTLYERAGGETGIHAIVEDFVPRALADPRVNWERHGVTMGGLSIHRGRSVSWNPDPEHLKILKLHLTQFLTLAMGGPIQYQGREMEAVHKHMHINNTEFDAAVGDFKATMDKLQMGNQEQKELLAIVESTRPQVVEER